jgi:hypothetical protein
MKKILLVFPVLALLVALGGCLVYNENPLYEQKDLLIDPDLAGVWQSDPKQGTSQSKVTFYPAADHTYHIVDLDDGKTTEFTGGLVKLNGKYFLDVFPTLGESVDVFPHKGHMIFRVTLNGKDRMKMALLKEDWMEGFLGKKSRQDAHVSFKIRRQKVQAGKNQFDDRDVILTGSTKDLQKTIGFLEDVKEAFDSDSDELIRSHK